MSVKDDGEKALAQSLAFNAEATRSGLFTTALDIANMMNEAGVPHAAPAILSGAMEFTAQLWVQLSLRNGVPPKAARETAEKEFRFYFRKHLLAEQAGVQEATKQ